MTKHIVSILAFMVVTFGVQGFSHFVLNKEHYAAMDHLRSEPIMPLGFAAMIIQGIIMTAALHRLAPGDASVRSGLLVSLAFGLFLASYISLAEPAKYAVPSILDWIKTEGTASLIQFSVFGVLLGLIHSKLG